MAAIDYNGIADSIKSTLETSMASLGYKWTREPITTVGNFQSSVTCSVSCLGFKPKDMSTGGTSRTAIFLIAIFAKGQDALEQDANLTSAMSNVEYYSQPPILALPFFGRPAPELCGVRVSNGGKGEMLGFGGVELEVSIYNEG